MRQTLKEIAILAGISAAVWLGSYVYAKAADAYVVEWRQNKVGPKFAPMLWYLVHYTGGSAMAVLPEPFTSLEACRFAARNTYWANPDDEIDATPTLRKIEWAFCTPAKVTEQ